MSVSPEYLAGKLDGLEKRLQENADNVLSAVKSHAEDDARHFTAVFAQGDGNRSDIGSFKLMVAEVKGMFKAIATIGSIAQIFVVAIVLFAGRELWAFHELATAHSVQIASLSQTVPPAIVMQTKEQSEENGRNIILLKQDYKDLKQQFAEALTELKRSNTNVKAAVETVKKAGRPAQQIIVVPSQPNGPGVIQRFIPKGRP